MRRQNSSAMPAPDCGDRTLGSPCARASQPRRASVPASLPPPCAHTRQPPTGTAGMQALNQSRLRRPASAGRDLRWQQRAQGAALAAPGGTAAACVAASAADEACGSVCDLPLRTHRCCSSRGEKGKQAAPDTIHWCPAAAAQLSSSRRRRPCRPPRRAPSRSCPCPPPPRPRAPRPCGP